MNTYQNSRVNIFTAYFHKLNMITFLIVSTLRKKTTSLNINWYKIKGFGGKVMEE